MDNPHTLAWRTIGGMILKRIDNTPGLTVHSLAIAAGIPKTTLDRKLKDGVSLTIWELERLAPALGYDSVYRLVDAAEQYAKDAA